MMPTYHVKGTITYRVIIHVDESVEAENEDDAAEILDDEYAPLPPGITDIVEWDDEDLEITEDDDQSVGEDVRMRRLGAPTLAGF